MSNTVDSGLSFLSTLASSALTALAATPPPSQPYTAPTPPSNSVEPLIRVRGGLGGEELKMAEGGAKVEGEGEGEGEGEEGVEEEGLVCSRMMRGASRSLALLSFINEHADSLFGFGRKSLDSSGQSSLEIERRFVTDVTHSTTHTAIYNPPVTAVAARNTTTNLNNPVSSVLGRFTGALLGVRGGGDVFSPATVPNPTTANGSSAAAAARQAEEEEIAKGKAFADKLGKISWCPAHVLQPNSLIPWMKLKSPPPSSPSASGSASVTRVTDPFSLLKGVYPSLCSVLEPVLLTQTMLLSMETCTIPALQK